MGYAGDPQARPYVLRQVGLFPRGEKKRLSTQTILVKSTNYFWSVHVWGEGGT